MNEVYIFDRLEHGNSGVYNYKLLAKLSLNLALKSTPQDFDVLDKEWGFWPIIAKSDHSVDQRNPLYIWDDINQVWKERKTKKSNNPIKIKNITSLVQIEELCVEYKKVAKDTYNVNLDQFIYKLQILLEKL